MDSFLAWQEWRASHGNDNGANVGTSRIYPWSVFRFLSETGRKQIEEYGEEDLLHFLAWSTYSPFERRHYRRVVASFFAWCQRHVLTSVSERRPSGRGTVRSSKGHGILRGIIASVLTPELSPRVFAAPDGSSYGPASGPNHMASPGWGGRREDFDHVQRATRSSLRPLLRLAGLVFSAVALEAAIAAWVMLRFSS